MVIHWRDGAFTEGDVSLNLDGTAFRFGCGLFETLYYNGRSVCHLNLHLERMHRSMEHMALKHLRLEASKLDGVIAQLIASNNLGARPARVNIYCFPDAPDNSPCSVLVTARPYLDVEARPLRLAIWPEHHLTPLARHKTMNYSFHALAQRQAKAAGYDGALLTDASGNILETTTSALIFMDNGRLITPASQPRLPSTALAAASAGLTIDEQVIPVAGLPSFGHAYALNSLMGMRPVTAIDAHEFTADLATCELATKRILCL